MPKYDDTAVSFNVWMSDRDFYYLRADEIHQFAGWYADHPDETDRFVADDDSKTPIPDTWAKAYYFATRGDAILGASYLTARREKYAHGYDMHDEGAYMLFTDYECDEENQPEE